MIRAMCVVKDEADIVGQTLERAAAWCDEILVLDNGSTDGTWQIVQARAAADDRVVAVGIDDQPFFDDIRIRLFDLRAEQARPGDWWCRLDADEFYVGDPRDVLRSAAPDARSVWSASLSYYFTDADAASYALDPSAYADDVPVEQKCRYYLNHWSEPRFFRHSPGLRWRVGDGGFPRAVWNEPVASERVTLQHFAYRSPQQIQRRLDARRAAFATNPEFSHEAVEDWSAAVAGIREHGGFEGTPGTQIPESWRSRIVPASSLDYDAHDGAFVLNPSLMPALPTPRTRAQRFVDGMRATARRVAPARG